MEIAGNTQVKNTRILARLPGTGGFDTAESIGQRDYCERLAGLLGSRLAFHWPVSGESTAGAPAQAEGDDLVLLFDPGLPAVLELLFGPAGAATIGGGPAAIMIVRRLHWPPREILLPVRIKTFEAPAVSWAGRLAYLFTARLTVLPLIPFQPGDYQWGSRQQDGIESVLAPNRPPGEMVRALLEPLGRWSIDGCLRLRQGDPAEQVGLEVARGEYDLIVIGPRKADR
jgi:hypothetical protein